MLIRRRRGGGECEDRAGRAAACAAHPGHSSRGARRHRAFTPAYKTSPRTPPSLSLSLSAPLYSSRNSAIASTGRRGDGRTAARRSGSAAPATKMPRHWSPASRPRNSPISGAVRAVAFGCVRCCVLIAGVREGAGQLCFQGQRGGEEGRRRGEKSAQPPPATAAAGTHTQCVCTPRVTHTQLQAAAAAHPPPATTTSSRRRPPPSPRATCSAPRRPSRRPPPTRAPAPRGASCRSRCSFG